MNMSNAQFAGDDEVAPQLDELDDRELLTLAREGSQEAYATLFSRYSYSAYRLTRHLGLKDESEDVVSESFAQVLALLRRGKGPDTAFRAYLFTTIRHEAARRAKFRQRVLPTDDVQLIDRAAPFGDGRIDEFERTSIRAAYESLPPRWRTALWQVEVEGLKPIELAPALQLSANGTSALVYRARSGLREAYLQQHVNATGPVDGEECQRARAKLSSFVRRTLSRREYDAVRTHLEACENCARVHVDLVEVNQHVGGSVADRF